MKLMAEILRESLQYNPQQRFSELMPFLEEVELNNCKTVLEIGSAEGGLSYIFSELFQRVVALDIYHTPIYEKWNIIRFTLDSSNPGDEFKRIEELGPYDLIFIDGNHTYEAVKKDFEIYSPLLSLGGIIAFHDIKDTEVQRNVNCFVSKFIKELEEANLHTSTKIFNEFTDEWSGRFDPSFKNHGGIQMFKFL
jgi:predicted O-methyltransferase YrrM